MKVNFVCDQCNNCIDESVSLFQVNNPPNLYRYTSICDGCVKARLLRTAKAQSKADWVAVARECYSGWLGPFGRFWCGIMAGNIFDQAWYQAHRAESPAESAIRECRATGRYGVTPLPDRKPAADELCLKTKHGEFLWRRSDTATEPAPCEFGGFQADGFTHPCPVTWQQAEREAMKTEARDCISSANIVKELHKWSDNSSSDLVRVAVREKFGTYMIIWRGVVLKIVMEKYRKTQWFLDGLEVPSDKVDGVLRASQDAAPFVGFTLVKFNGAWVPMAVMSPDSPSSISGLRIVAPSSDSLWGATTWNSAEDQQAYDAFTAQSDSEENDDVGDDSENGAPESEALVGDVSSLAHLITTAIDKADGRDYSVILKYKKCGDLATAKVGIEVVGTEVVVANSCDNDIEMKVSQAYTPPDVENGPDSSVETIDLSYGSDFDKVMDAVYDVVRTGQLPGLDKSLLSGPDWNQFYCAVKAMRRANYGCARDRGQ